MWMTLALMIRWFLFYFVFMLKIDVMVLFWSRLNGSNVVVVI